MSGQTAPAVENLTFDHIREGLASGQILLVDVREPNEWDAGRIPGATLNALSIFDPAALPAEKPGQRIGRQPSLSFSAPAR